LRRYRESELPIRAAALAYHTLLGIVPILGLVFWYLQRIGVTSRWLALTKGFFLAQLNLDPKAPMVRTFESLTAKVQGSSWGWIGLVVLLYTASNLVWRFGEALDAVLDSAPHPPEKRMNPWRLACNRLVAMFGLPLALTLSLVVTTWIKEDSLVHVLFHLETVGPIIALPVAWFVDILAFFVIYYLIPRSPVPWREALKAAVIVGPISEFLRHLFSVYTGHAVSTQKIYGVFAVVPLFILWVQLAWSTLLAGAMLIRFPPSARSRETAYQT
jgi:membrane protein